MSEMTHPMVLTDLLDVIIETKTRSWTEISFRKLPDHLRSDNRYAEMCVPSSVFFRISMYLSTQFPSLEPDGTFSVWVMDKSDYIKMRMFFGGQGWTT